jgi:hypothetical protein
MNLPDLNNIKTITLFGGVLCIITYALIKRDKSMLTEGVGAFLSGNGIVGGSYLCILSFNKFMCENLDLEQSRLYVFLGGTAVLWISVTSIRSKLIKTSVTSP